MSDVPVQLVVAAFQDEGEADEVLKELKVAKRDGLIKIENAAILRKDEKGKLHIKETHDMGGGKGAAIGGIGGAAIGVLAGPALLVPVAVGALIGGLAAKLRDSGFSNQRLETLGASLKPGSSAIVAVVEHTWVDEVKEAMAEEATDVMTAEIGADIAAQLEAGHEVAYSAVASQAGFVAERVAGGEDESEGGVIVADDTGIYAGRYVATPDGFAVEEMALTDEGVVDVVAVGVPVEEPDRE